MCADLCTGLDGCGFPLLILLFFFELLKVTYTSYAIYSGIRDLMFDLIILFLLIMLGLC